MKRQFFYLAICAALLASCSGSSTEPSADSRSTEEQSDTLTECSQDSVTINTDTTITADKGTVE